MLDLNKPLRGKRTKNLVRILDDKLLGHRPYLVLFTAEGSDGEPYEVVVQYSKSELEASLENVPEAPRCFWVIDESRLVFDNEQKAREYRVLADLTDKVIRKYQEVIEE